MTGIPTIAKGERQPCLEKNGIIQHFCFILLTIFNGFSKFHSLNRKKKPNLNKRKQKWELNLNSENC